jgi:hypothetical protein
VSSCFCHCRCNLASLSRSVSSVLMETRPCLIFQPSLWWKVWCNFYIDTYSMNKQQMIFPVGKQCVLRAAPRL